MSKSISLILCIFLAGIIAWAASRTPAPAPERSGDFSAQRAMADVLAIGATPHPIGSAEHDRVRDYVVRRFGELGLQPVVWRGHALERDEDRGEAFIEGGEVQDIIAVLPGASPTLPAIVIMAHYDSVPSSPGAADDTVGVAAALEIAKALKDPAVDSPFATAAVQGRPERDVIFLVTDGEEAGLLGARAFFASHPLARHIGAVLNMESAGGGGRAYMFETGPANGAMIALYQRVTARPAASSLTGYVYSLMSNDTDFTVSKRLGIAGFNYAFFGRPFDYHSASSTPSATEAGSLQHIGEQVLAAARALAFEPALPPKATGPVYQDLLGGLLIAYPVWAGWLVIVAAAALAAPALGRMFKREALRLLDAARGALGLLMSLVLTTGLLWLVRALTGIPASFVQEKALTARFGLYEVALAGACTGSALLVFRLAGFGRTRFWSAFAGAFVLALILTTALQAMAPLVAFLLAWPLLVAGGIAALLAFGWNGERLRLPALAFTVPPCALALAQTAYMAHGLALAVGAGLPEVLALTTMIACLVLFPLLWPEADDRRPPIMAIGALVIVFGLVLFIRTTDPWSARHPRPTQALYVVDLAGGRYLRASTLPGPDAWTRSFLVADGGPIGRASLRPIAANALIAPARPVAVVKPQVAISRDASGRVRVQLAPGGAVRQLRLDLSAAGPLTDLTIDGLTVAPSTGVRRWTHIAWDAPPPEGITAAFTAPAGTVLVRYGELIDGWPQGARPLPPRPADAMPWMNTDGVAVIGSISNGR